MSNPEEKLVTSVEDLQELYSPEAIEAACNLLGAFVQPGPPKLFTNSTAQVLAEGHVALAYIAGALNAWGAYNFGEVNDRKTAHEACCILTGIVEGLRRIDHEAPEGHVLNIFATLSNQVDNIKRGTQSDQRPEPTAH